VDRLTTIEHARGVNSSDQEGDGMLQQAYEDYTAEHVQVWAILYARQLEFLRVAGDRHEPAGAAGDVSDVPGF
jgi:phenylalanine-4-hydroxylase